MKRREWLSVVALVLFVQVASFAVRASFTASPVPWDSNFETNQPANSDPVSQGAAHIRQVKGETSRRAGVEHDWGTFGNVTTDLGRHLLGSARVFVQSAAPTVNGTTSATCMPEADSAGNRYCDGGRLWYDSDIGQVYASLDDGLDGDADRWFPISTPTKICTVISTVNPACAVNFDSTLYSFYEAVFYGITNGASTNLILRSDTSAGASYDSGASDYAWSYSGRNGAVSASSNADSKVILDFLSGGFVSASGRVRITKNSLTEFVYEVGHWPSTQDIISGTTGSGIRKDTGTVNAIQISGDTGTFTGTLHVYGYR